MGYPPFNGSGYNGDTPFLLLTQEIIHYRLLACCCQQIELSAFRANELSTFRFSRKGAEGVARSAFPFLLPSPSRFYAAFFFPFTLIFPSASYSASFLGP